MGNLEQQINQWHAEKRYIRRQIEPNLWLVMGYGYKSFAPNKGTIASYMIVWCSSRAEYERAKKSLAASPELAGIKQEILSGQNTIQGVLGAYRLRQQWRLTNGLARHRQRLA